MLDPISESIKDATDILTLVQNYGVVTKRAGKHFVARCPFHSEKTPSFTIYPDTNSFHCFGCNAAGDVFSFVKRIANVDFMEAKRILAERAGISLPEYTTEQKESFQERALVEEIWTLAAFYYHEQFNPTARQSITIEGQGFQGKYPITAESIETFRIGWAPAESDLLSFLKEKGYSQEQLLKTGLFIKTQEGIKEFFQNRIIFPYLKSGKAVYFIARKTDLTPENEYEKGKYKKLLTYSESLPYVSKTIKNEYFYNEDALRSAFTLIITEGITDCISYHQLGFACISPGTTRFRKDDQPRAEHLLKTTELIYLSNDNEENESGMMGALDTAEFLEGLGKKVRLILLPRPPEVGKIDAADYIKSHSKSDVQRLINTAPTPLEYQIKQIPRDCPERDLAHFLAPFIAKIASMKKMEQNFYIRLLKDQLKLSKQEIKEILKQEAKKSPGQTGRELEIVEQEGILLQTLFSELSLDRPLLLPSRWGLSERGLSVLIEGEAGEAVRQMITHEPLFIKSISQDLELHTERLTLTHKREGEWREVSIPRGIAFDHHKIVQLADLGFPVTSLNAKGIVKFLSEFEGLNIENLNKSFVIHGFGYREGRNKEKIFFLPHCQVGTNDLLQFEPNSPGDEVFHRGLTTKGSYDLWRQAISRCVEHPRIMFAKYCSFTAILLEPLGFKQGFTVDFFGDSSSGKSIAMEIIMSGFGDPHILVQSWDSTKNAAERLADCLNGIPIALDESQVVDSKVAYKILYMVTNGVGRARAAKGGGLQRIAKWLTTLFSNGERSIIETTLYNGADARTIPIYGSPWGAVNKQMAAKADAIREVISQNYGHAVGPFVEEVYRIGKKELQREYQEYQGYFVANARDTGLDMRKAKYFAAICLAGRIAEHLFGFGASPMKVCEEIWQEATAEEHVDYATKAIRFVASWVNANRNSFDQVGTEKTVDRGEVFGVIHPGEYVAIFPHKLKELLIKGEFSPSTVLREWKNREWIHTVTKENTYPVQFRTERARMIKFFWKSLLISDSSKD